MRYSPIIPVRTQVSLSLVHCPLVSLPEDCRYGISDFLKSPQARRKSTNICTMYFLSLGSSTPSGQVVLVLVKSLCTKRFCSFSARINWSTTRFSWDMIPTPLAGSCFGWLFCMQKLPSLLRILLVFPGKTLRIHENTPNSRTGLQIGLSLVWFAGATPEQVFNCLGKLQI